VLPDEVGQIERADAFRAFFRLGSVGPESGRAFQRPIWDERDRDQEEKTESRGRCGGLSVQRGTFGCRGMTTRAAGDARRVWD
jgi:hypothetical protein